MLTASRIDGHDSPLLCLQLQSRARVLQFSAGMGITPDTRQDLATSDELRVALVAWPPQKNVRPAKVPTGTQRSMSAERVDASPYVG